VGDAHSETECKANGEGTSRDRKVGEAKGHSARHRAKRLRQRIPWAACVFEHGDGGGGGGCALRGQLLMMQYFCYSML
jgi:hypothetical protein